jgi:hypothetical protein
MESNARFLIGVQLEDPAAEYLSFVFQQDLWAKQVWAVRVPRRHLDELGPAVLCERVTEFYLWQFPEELERVDQATVLGAVHRALLPDEKKGIEVV